MQVEIMPVPRAQQPILANLLELYAHDFSEFLPVGLGPEGRFGYPELPLYWEERDRFPFFLRVDGNLAGLALVKKGSKLSGNQTVWDMAEFFILRGFRRHHVGTKAACTLWKKFPGNWEIRVIQSNLPARLFWERAISTFTNEVSHTEFESGGKLWHCFFFESG